MVSGLTKTSSQTLSAVGTYDEQEVVEATFCKRRRRLEIPEPPPDQKKRRVGMTDKTLDEKNRNFAMRLDIKLGHWPTIPEEENPPRCQLHTWATNSKIRKKAKVLHCKCCNVFLCAQCFEIFHTEPDLVGKKAQIRRKMFQSNI